MLNNTIGHVLWNRAITRRTCRKPTTNQSLPSHTIPHIKSKIIVQCVISIWWETIWKLGIWEEGGEKKSVLCIEQIIVAGTQFEVLWLFVRRRYLLIGDDEEEERYREEGGNENLG